VKFAFGEGSRRPLVRGIVIVVAFLLLLIVDRQIVRFNGDMFNRDFFSLWGGGRCLLDGVDCYDEEAWADLHIRYGSDWLENAIYIYPPPVAILFLPLALLPVPLAATVWEFASQVMLVVAVVALVAGLRARKSLVVLLLPLVLLSRPAIVISTSGQLSAMWPFSLCLFYWFAHCKRYVLAGGVLTLLVLRPSVSLILLPVALAWLLTQRAWCGLLGFGFLGVAGLGLSLIVVPGWIEKWITFILIKEGHYAPAVATLWGLAHDLLATRFPGHIWLVAFAVVSALLVIACMWWLTRVRDPRSLALWLACATCLTILITPYSWPYDQMLLLFPLGVVFAVADRMDRRRRLLVWGAGVGVMNVLPFVFVAVAQRRGVDTLSALTPLAMLFLLMGAVWWSDECCREVPVEQGGGV
jgi:hypothetical protein